MKTTKETIECPKCQGAGYIGAFAHIANGVCFCCDGNGTIEINRAAMIAKLSDDTRKKAEWILSTTPDDYADMSYTRLFAVRDFCHGGWGLPEAYPTLYAHWFEVGEVFFQAAQMAKLAAM